jgi:hypothetical protein
MAATIGSPKDVQISPWPVTETQFSAIVAGLEEEFAHGGYAAARVQNVRMTVTTPPTSNDPVLFSWIKADDDTTNGTVTVKFDTTPGGDLTGCVASVFVEFADMKGGAYGLTTTNPAGNLTPIMS